MPHRYPAIGQSFTLIRASEGRMRYAPTKFQRRKANRRPSINLPDNRRGEKSFAPIKNRRRKPHRRASITPPDNRRGEKFFAPTKTQRRMTCRRPSTPCNH